MRSLPKTLPKFIWHYIKLYKWAFLACVLLNLLYAFSYAIIPYIFKLIIDTISSNTENLKNIWEYVDVYIYTILTATIIGISSRRSARYIEAYNSANLTAQTKTDIFSYIQNHSYKYFADNLSGTLIDKVKDLTRGTHKITYYGINILSAFCEILFALIIFIKVDWWLCLYFGIWVVLHFSISAYSLPKWKRTASLYGKAWNLTTGKVVDSISNNANVKMFSAKQNEYNRIEQQVDKEIKRGRTHLFNMQKTMIYQSFFVHTVIDIGLLYILLQGIINGTLTVGDLAFVWFAISPIAHTIFYLTWDISEMTGEYGKSKQALDTINKEHDIVDVKGATPLDMHDASINFANIDFAYNEKREIFKNFSLVIPAGQKVGIVGKSGAGKSTLSQLLLRYYDINTGHIYIGGQDIAMVSQDSLRKAITIVPQDSVLFHRSIMENIRYGKQNATDEEVYEAAKKANAHGFILTLSNGYDTLVGERGIKLSAGQRQRIAIARAILKNAPIVIMDEATSALDSETERHIQASMENLIENKTSIVIAHRLSTLKAMDRLIVMNDGKIIEDGSHKDLIANQGYYYKLWTLQHGGFIGQKDDENE